MRFLRNNDDKRLRKDRTGANALSVGVIVLVIAAVLVYFGFTKDNPLSRPFQMQAVFKSSNSIRKNSPVRIAGVNVGKVKDIQAKNGTNYSVVTMEIQKKGLPIHKDATAKIRP